jgi:hypothetical protein
LTTSPSKRISPLRLDSVPMMEPFPAAARQRTDDGTHGRGFSHAVTPEQRRYLALLTAQAHAEQRLDRAVKGFDIT